MGLYEYVMSKPLNTSDPSGTDSRQDLRRDCLTLCFEITLGNLGPEMDACMERCMNGKFCEIQCSLESDPGSKEYKDCLKRCKGKGLRFKFYGNHCGPGHGDRQRSGGGPPKDGTDACCAEHDRCYQLGDFGGYKPFDKSCGQSICDSAMCACLKKRMKEGGLDFSELIHNLIMQIVFCNFNDNCHSQS